MQNNGRARRRVLVVEDQLVIAMHLEEIVCSAGCEVVGPFGRLDHAVIAASDILLDAALLDVDLGGEASFPVAHVLRKRGIPFAFVTGQPQWQIPVDLHAIPVMAKPITERGVRLALLHLLEPYAVPG
ncbi:MAG: response regulator [Dongiaceae bacterium]